MPGALILYPTGFPLRLLYKTTEELSNRGGELKLSLAKEIRYGTIFIFLDQDGQEERKSFGKMQKAEDNCGTGLLEIEIIERSNYEIKK